MPGMNEFLTAAYGTAQPQPAPQEDAEKVAHAELFAKLAAEQGIDLSKLSEQEVSEAWNTFYSQTKTAAAATKTAEKHGHKEKEPEAHGHKEKEAAARAEFVAEKEWQQKTAEADFLGRQMAHAYVQELRKIASDLTPEDPEKTAAKVPEGLKGHAGGFLNKLREHGESLANKAVHSKAGDKAMKAGEHVGKHRGAYAGGAGVAAGAAGGFAAGHHKKASALDELAALKAVEKAAAANYDATKVAAALADLFDKGEVKDSEKIASVTDFKDAVEVRSLELLEGIGFKVEWPSA